MASTSTWTPAPGRHKVNIGSSLGRALKARKSGPPPQKRSNLPDRDFYSLRYNFKPSSIDSSKPGSIQVKRNKDVTNSSIIVEHPISQANEVHVYKGREEPAKEWACVLIFDEETGGYTLEKIDSFVALEHVERRAASVSEPTPAPTPPANTPIETDEPDPLDDILPDDLVSRPTAAKIKQNDSSEEDIPIQREIASSSSSRQQQPAPPQRAPPKSAPTRSRPQAAPPKSPPKPAVPAPAATKAKPKKGRRQTPELSDDGEVLDVQKQPPPKRSRPSPPPPQVPQPSTVPKRSAAPKKQPAPPPPAPPPQRAALELPGAGGAPSAFIPPAPSRNPPLPTQRSVPQPNPEPPILVPSDLDSEDDDMVEVSASPPEVDPAPGVSHNLTMIEETFENEHENENVGVMEIDVDEFANMMEEHLEEEEDGVPDEGPYDGDMFGSESETELPMPVQRVGSGPMSLNAFAGGGAYEDVTSSSDDSDEDED
ncbi:hypothetical protein VNI00_004835 [Paramarasmius palmivorus]|uniref:Transcription elongation factor Eaf N-terminal domain-containing protein n=1 Tax=Paramarasmius palmivorus TaxID=297713 RepID=A0AAW0DIR1_9AGAR